MSDEEEIYVIKVNRKELNLLMTSLLTLKIRKRSLIRAIKEEDDKDNFNHSGSIEDETERGIIAIERGLNEIIRLRQKLAKSIEL